MDSTISKITLKKSSHCNFDFLSGNYGFNDNYMVRGTSPDTHETEHSTTTHRSTTTLRLLEELIIK